METNTDLPIGVRRILAIGLVSLVILSGFGWVLFSTMPIEDAVLTLLGIIILVLAFGSGFVERLQTDRWESGVLPLLVASYGAGYAYVLSSEAPLYVVFALAALFVLVLVQFIEPHIESGTRVFGGSLIVIGLLFIGIVITGGRIRVGAGVVGGIGLFVLGLWMVFNPDGFEI